MYKTCIGTLVYYLLYNLYINCSLVTLVVGLYFIPPTHNQQNFNFTLNPIQIVIISIYGYTIMVMQYSPR